MLSLVDHARNLDVLSGEVAQLVESFLLEHKLLLGKTLKRMLQKHDPLLLLHALDTITNDPHNSKSLSLTFERLFLAVLD